MPWHCVFDHMSKTGIACHIFNASTFAHIATVMSMQAPYETRYQVSLRAFQIVEGYSGTKARLEYIHPFKESAVCEFISESPHGRRCMFVERQDGKRVEVEGQLVTNEAQAVQLLNRVLAKRPQHPTRCGAVHQQCSVDLSSFAKALDAGSCSSSARDALIHS